MLLAGDVGGTKTFIGLFTSGAPRPSVVETRIYRTLDFPDLTALTERFLHDTGAAPADIECACFGVAGPVSGTRAQLTNVPWAIDVDALKRRVTVGPVFLLNDLEAFAWSVAVLGSDEVLELHQGHADPRGNVALVAAGTGLGIALLPRVDGRLVPKASEGGHVDFAPRNAEERALADALTREFGRADVERVVSGPGIANIHRLLYPHACRTLEGAASPDELPAAVSRAALEHGCEQCGKSLRCFVSAYGATAGNLALTTLATGGIYVGGGIAPRIVPAMQWPVFMESFLAKSPMEALISRVPVKVILNPRAGILGAATYAAQRDP
jgi:glucokinase